MQSFFVWMETLPSSIMLRESINGYPVLLTSHIVSMCLFVGLIAFWDMRLAGLALRGERVSTIPPRIFPWALGLGFLISLVTGALLFYSQPMRYYTNFWFWLKSGMLILAGVNAAVFHLTTYQSVDTWDTAQVTPPAARFAGVFSLALWAGIIITGRMTAYSGLVPQWWVDLGLGN
jgi:hypothetical protein